MVLFEKRPNWFRIGHCNSRIINKVGVIKKILIMNRLLDDIYAKSLASLLNIDFFTMLLKKGAGLFSRINQPPLSSS